MPALPLIFAVASLELSPRIERPSTAVTRSPGWSSASSAGEPSNTVRMRKPRSTCSTVIPTPSNCPDVDSRNCAYAFGLK